MFIVKHYRIMSPTTAPHYHMHRKRISNILLLKPLELRYKTHVPLQLRYAVIYHFHVLGPKYSPSGTTFLIAAPAPSRVVETMVVPQ